MLRALALLAALMGVGGVVSAEVAVRESEGRVDVTAKAAPLAEVLERIGRQTGMKVVYEGQAPRQLVTLALVGRLPADAVASVLEGQGLNYALVMDASAMHVQKLLVSGAPAAAPGATRFPASAASPARGRRLVPSRPSAAASEASEPEPAAPEEEEPPAPAPVAEPEKPPSPPSAGPGVPSRILPPVEPATPFNARPLLFPPTPPPQPSPTPPAQ